MRSSCRVLAVAVGVALWVALRATTAAGGEESTERTDSTIRLIPVSHSMDEPPATAAMAEEPAPSPTAPTSPDPPSPEAPSPEMPPSEVTSPEVASSGSTPRQAERPVPRLPYRRPSASAATLAHPLPEPQVTNQTRQALRFYGGNPARQTLSQFPRRTPIQAGPSISMRQQIKPFHAVYREPTVSPYLNLYREEDDTQSAPNYFALVRPQMEQIEASRLQQTEIQMMLRQMNSRGRTTSVPQHAISGYGPAGTPEASQPARYMDTAQFYGGWAR